jgi:hypothetical protein
VVGFDGSEASRRALMCAGSAAGARDVVVVHAALPSDASEAETIAEAAEPRDVLRAAEELLRIWTCVLRRASNAPILSTRLSKPLATSMPA